MIFNRISNQDLLCFRYTNFGYVMIHAGSSGYYQQQFWGMDRQVNPPLLLWVFIAFIGGILLLLKEMKLHQQQKKSLICVDIVFILPVICIPSLPIRHDYALLFILIYTICFLIVCFKIYTKNKHPS